MSKIGEPAAAETPPRDGPGEASAPAAESGCPEEARARALIPAAVRGDRAALAELTALPVDVRRRLLPEWMAAGVAWRAGRVEAVRERIRAADPEFEALPRPIELDGGPDRVYVLSREPDGCGR